MAIILTSLSAFVIACLYVSIYHTPEHKSACRLPDLNTEYRVIIQTTTDHGLQETCSIEPRNPEEGRRKTIERLLRRAQKADGVNR